MSKAAAAFRTISEVSNELDVPKHVLRFWELKFAQLKPMKRGGGRRYYRPEDLAILRGIRHLLYDDGYTIKGVQKILRERGIQEVKDVVAAATDLGEATLKTRRSAKSSSSRPKSARGKAVGSPASGQKVDERSVARTGKRGGVGKGAPAGLSGKSVKALQKVIKELQACRESLYPQSGVRASRASPVKQRRARASR